MVGWGTAASFSASGPRPASTAWQQFRDWSRKLDSDPLAFGSFPFDPAAPGRLVVPAVTIVRTAQGRRSEIICAPQTDLLAIIEAGRQSTLMRDPAAPRLREVDCADARRSWTSAVSATTTVLADRTAGIEKVVLSRAVDVVADRPLDELRIARWLGEHHRDCWTFSHEGLIGATPELLVEVSEAIFRCRILAGTRTPAWEGELLDDPKERHEHELSVDSVTARLEEAGLNDPHLDGPFLLRLPNVTHLATDITASLDPAVSSAHITDVLFPTAAICGTPRSAAFEQIRRVESIDRGRFSGPVGWTATDGSGQWGLALRCAQLSPDSRAARIFAGAGILASSEPDNEWHETQAKMAPMRQALHHG
ncbi:menaquinone-specific isochorismate synthase [Propionibacterium cyclohexanicum]|uniref:Menaquinone-specific isochorismate synthase n=2 Tax=Propionibacterium cyclohexanicum TaxID=64702 RepID=A0A1H9QD47_9ACTN|nr:menaquinone-specific isochorismate synthase [Propionibacterium cyclohexanicum]